MSVTDYDAQSNIDLHIHENDYLSVLIRGAYLEEGQYVGPEIQAENRLYGRGFSIGQEIRKCFWDADLPEYPVNQ